MGPGVSLCCPECGAVPLLVGWGGGFFLGGGGDAGCLVTGGDDALAEGEVKDGGAD